MACLHETTFAEANKQLSARTRTTRKRTSENKKNGGSEEEKNACNTPSVIHGMEHTVASPPDLGVFLPVQQQKKKKKVSLLFPEAHIFS